MTKEIVLTDVEKFSGWGKLSVNEQTAIKQEATDVLQYLKSEANTKLAIGEGLLKIQDVLLPKRLFVKFLKEVFHMSSATGYRYIELYSTGKKLLPKPVLELAVTRGTPIREEVITKNPPPQTTDPVEINKYLDSLSAVRTVQHPVMDKDIMLKECANFIRIRDSRIENPAERTKWRKDLLGVLYTMFGFDASTTIKPKALPEDFFPVMGRPAAKKIEPKKAA